MKQMCKKKVSIILCIP